MFGFQPHKGHNMLAFTLNPRYEGLGLITDYISKE
jgi:hypothetical protein